MISIQVEVRDAIVKHLTDAASLSEMNGLSDVASKLVAIVYELDGAQTHSFTLDGDTLTFTVHGSKGKDLSKLSDITITPTPSWVPSSFTPSITGCTNADESYAAGYNDGFDAGTDSA